MRGPFVGSVVSAPISSAMVVVVARIPSVVVISVARVPSVVVISDARVPSVIVISDARVPSVVVISDARICVARGLCRFVLVDRRWLKVKVWTLSELYSCRRGWRKRRARSWCVEGARCCEVRGVTSLQELSEPHVHFLDAPFLKTLPRAAVPCYVVHLGAGFFRSQLDFPHAPGEVLKC